MGVMITAKDLNPLIEYADSRFRDMQLRIVGNTYPNKCYEMYLNYENLTEEELKEWKKLTNAQINKLLFIEEKVEFTPTQIKRMLPQIEQIIIINEASKAVLDYIIYTMNYCLDNRCNIKIMRR